VACVVAALGLSGVALPADAAGARSRATATKHCHTAKRKGKRVRVCVKTSKKRKPAKHKPAKRKPVKHKPAKHKPARRKPVEKKAPPLAPIDYTALSGLSQPTFTGVERTTHELVVGDGTRLHLEIVKPTDAKDLGVILEASPYHGTLYDRTGGRMIPLPGKDGKLVGLSGFFPKRGYAVVFMDLRGTGLSSGCLSSLGRADQSDLRDVIQWAATQPWSNGRVDLPRFGGVRLLS
jgi:hypothetical protein